MPKSIHVFYWNERSGPEIIANYPKDVTPDKSLLFQIYLAHQHNEEPGLVAFANDKANIISFNSLKTKESLPVYIFVVLNAAEESGRYENALIDVSREIINTLRTDPPQKMVSILPNLFLKITMASMQIPLRLKPK